MGAAHRLNSLSWELERIEQHPATRAAVGQVKRPRHPPGRSALAETALKCLPRTYRGDEALGTGEARLADFCLSPKQPAVG